ncbi:MAG: serine/threonine-protein kinase [Nannocystaceae bacterium]|nr:serine/threonine-protein kinase [Nannocystaceae bacterium]
MDEREASPLAQHLVAAAPGDSLDREVVFARVRAGLVAEPTAPRTVGRFVIERRLGAGAMGTVYAARDPELDRLVAIKLLHDRDADARLRKEAKLLAQLRHPNVVRVFELGSAGDRAFVVMELVEGGDLGAWLRQQPRRWQQVVAVFVAAGRGLAAAHAAGTIHRDFKPENVLFGTAGAQPEPAEVKVADFGLARQRARVAAGAELAATGDGAVGTPAYMAPEVLTGDAATPHSDQFSFCVALWEALWGERVGGTRATFALPPPASGRVPPRLRLILERGMQVRPASRWRDMDALLEALSRTLRPRRWPVLGGVGAFATASVVAMVSPPARTVCPELALEPAWRDTVRDAVAARLDRGGEEAAAGGRYVVARLDARVGALQQRRQVACNVARRDDAGSEALTGCLDRAELELAVAVDELLSAPPDAITRVAALVPDAGTVTACDDAEQLAREAVLPAEQRPRQLELLRALHHAAAQAAVHGPAAARDATAAVVEQAVALGHPPTLAAALIERARLQHADGEDERAIATLREAVITAERGGADNLRASAMGLLARRLADRGDFDGARDASAQADALLQRLASPPASLAAASALRLAHIEGLAQGPAAAVPHYEAALAAARAGGEEEIDALLDALSGMGVAEFELSRLDAARAHLGEAATLLAARFGEQHPDYGRVLASLAACDFRSGNLDDAEVGFRKALAIRARDLPPDAVGLVPLRTNLALIAFSRGRWREAADELGAVLAIRERALGPEDPGIAGVLVNLSLAQARLGELDAAVASAQRALALRQSLVGPDHPSTGSAWHTLAQAQARRGQTEAAEAAFRRALAIADAVPGAPDRYDSLLGLAELLRTTQRGDELPALLDGQAPRCTAAGAPPPVCAGLDFTLARALPPAERMRALGLVESARARLGDRTDEPIAAELDAWLAEHGGVRAKPTNPGP